LRRLRELSKKVEKVEKVEGVEQEGWDIAVPLACGVSPFSTCSTPSTFICSMINLPQLFSFPHSTP
jgi:hypothetical protein